MTKLNGDTIQAVPLIDGKINMGAGTYTAKGVIHAEQDADLTLHLSTDVPYTIPAGQDRAYVGSFTVLTGVVTYE